MSLQRSRRSIRFAACWLIAAFALQCLVMAAFVNTQRSAGRSVDELERARTHVERVAYLTLRFRAGDGDAKRREQLDASLGAVTRSLLVRPIGDPFTGSDAHAHNGLAGSAAALVSAARAAASDPAASGPAAEVDRLTPIVIAQYDDVVRRRGEIVSRRNELYVAAIVAGFVLESFAFGWIWLRSLRPAQLELAQSYADLESDRAQLQSLFDQNPDAIAVYDMHRMLVGTNEARCALMGLRADEMLGRPLRTFVEPWCWADAETNFDRAMRGEFIVTETQLRAANGSTVDVEVSVFPHVINGQIRGVISASRDVSALVYAKRRSDEVAGRLAALCEIASAGEDGWLDQVSATLQLVAGELGYEHGVISDIDLERKHVTALALTGDPPGLVLGRNVPLDESLARHIVSARDVWVVDDLKRSPFIEYSARHGAVWRAVAGIGLQIGGKLAGSIVLGDSQPRTSSLHATDRNFLKITAALLGATIDRGRHTAHLDSLAFSDALTGLANRPALERRLEALVTEARRRGDRFAVHYIDLDRFKQVNDCGGHDTGDAVLRETARRLRACARTGDIVGRLGGDEFIVIQPNAGGQEGAHELAERIVRAIDEPYVIGGTTYSIGCSIGISVFPDDGDAVAGLLRRADQAMYEAKHTRDSAVIFAA